MRAMRSRNVLVRWLAAATGSAALLLGSAPAMNAVGPMAPGGGGEDTSPGNNLAVPVIWAESADVGVRPVLRGTGPQTEDLTLDTDPASHVVVDGVDLFVQKTLNEWQSENADASSLTGLPTTDTGKLPITYVDWGDNLEAKDWRTGMHVRIETKMLQDVSGLTDPEPADASNTAGMTGYTMMKVGGQGQDEQWGVMAVPDASIWHAVSAQSDQAIVYTSQACLTIERIDKATSLTWDATTRTWTEDGVVKCVGEVTDGPGGYGAEVTVSGGMTYGFNWPTKAVNAGLYRLTFSLKPDSGADFTDATSILQPVEEEESAVVAEKGGPAAGGKPAGNVAVLMPEENLTYIDIGVSYDESLPTKPLDLNAVRGEEAVALTWKAPASAGNGPITEYAVSGKLLADGSQLPEVLVPADRALETSYLGLTGGEPYEFSVAAVTPSGAGDTSTVVATPTSKVPTLVKDEVIGIPGDRDGDKVAKRMNRKLRLKIRVKATNRIRVRAFGEVYGKQHGKNVRSRSMARRFAAGPA